MHHTTIFCHCTNVFEDLQQKQSTGHPQVFVSVPEITGKIYECRWQKNKLAHQMMDAKMVSPKINIQLS